MVSKTIFLAGTISVSSLILSSFIQFFLASKLGLKEYGVFSFNWSICVIASSIFSFGLIQTTLQYVPKYASNNQNEYIHAYLRSIFNYFILFLLPLCTLSTILYLSLSEPPPILNNFQYFLFLALTISATSIFSVITRCLNGGMFTVFFEKVSKELLMMTSIIILMIFKIDFEYELIIKLMLIFSFVSMFMTLILMLRKSYTIGVFSGGKRIYEFKLWFKSSTSFVIIILLYMLMIRVDVLLIPIWHSSEEVGIYSMAARLVEFIAFGLFSLHLATLPMIARAFQSQKTKQMKRIINITIYAGAISGLLVATLLFIWGEEILTIMGDEFLPAYILILIMLGPQVLRAIDGTSGNLMTIIGLDRILLKIAILTFILKMVLSLTLIKSHGALGAAWSTSITLVTTLAVQSWIVSKHLNFPVGLFGNLFYRFKVFH